MMIVTGKDFRSNQTKYIKMAQTGEDVVLSSRISYVRLLPVYDEDGAWNENVASRAFQDAVQKARKEHKEGKTLKFECAADAQKWMDET